ncbi:MAG: hypothetical protein M1812_006063 [Candelaria pacifica]|nr:MAG: hypothetical protein M1812_006063 [Candelaria pacifica]
MALAALRSSPRASPFKLTNTTTFWRMSQYRTIHLSSYIVTPKELSNALAKTPKTKIGESTAPRVIPLCASWFLPNEPDGRKGIKVFKEQRIPTARFFDIDMVNDHDSDYPHMLPSPELFAKSMEILGIRKDDEVVLYDSQEIGIFSAPRAAWTFRVFGHPKVHILNNFRLWVEQGYPTESGEHTNIPSGSTSDYPTPNFDPGMVVKFAEMKDIARDYGKEGAEGVQVLDARSAGRFMGTEPEPRPGVSSGHIPGSINIPVPELLDPKTKTLLPGVELRKVFESKSIDPTRPIISSCGTGVTAAVIDAALEAAEYGDPSNRRIYDGSWTEWAQRVNTSDNLIKKKI